MENKVAQFGSRIRKEVREMLLRKTDQKIPGLRQDLLIDTQNGNFVVEINQRNESDMLWILQSYMEMDREISLLNG